MTRSGSDDPAAEKEIQRPRLPPADCRIEDFGLAVGRGHQALLEGEEDAAQSERQHHERECRAIEADAAGLHDRQFAAPRQQAVGDEGAEQCGDGNDVVNELRRHQHEELSDHARGRLALEDLVRAVDERRDVEQPEQRQRREPGDADVEPADVAIDQAWLWCVQARQADDEHHAGAGATSGGS